MRILEPLSVLLFLLTVVVVLVIVTVPSYCTVFLVVVADVLLVDWRRLVVEVAADSRTDSIRALFVFFGFRVLKASDLLDSAW